MTRKRASPRVAIDKRVEWNGHSALTRDIGGGGLFLRTAEPPPVGSMLDLRLALHDDTPPLTVAARVLRNHVVPEAGAALRFGDDQPTVRAEIAYFLLSVLAAQGEEVSSDTTEVVPLVALQVAEWKGLLEHKEAQLAEALNTMARTRDAVQSANASNLERASELDRRERLLRIADDKNQRERATLDQEWQSRQRELDVRRAKLVELAEALKEQRRKLSERSGGLDGRALDLDETARRLENTERQLQVYAFERNRLAQQMQRSRSERESLEKKIESLEELLSSHEDHTELSVLPREPTPAEDPPAVHDIATAPPPMNARARYWMRIQVAMRSWGAQVRSFFTEPGN